MLVLLDRQSQQNYQTDILRTLQKCEDIFWPRFQKYPYVVLMEVYFGLGSKSIPMSSSWRYILASVPKVSLSRPHGGIFWPRFQKYPYVVLMEVYFGLGSKSIPMSSSWRYILASVPKVSLCRPHGGIFWPRFQKYPYLVCMEHDNIY